MEPKRDGRCSARASFTGSGICSGACTSCASPRVPLSCLYASLAGGVGGDADADDGGGGVTLQN